MKESVSDWKVLFTGSTALAMGPAVFKLNVRDSLQL
jgi:hypothetical protein